jgi:hypothetical protein
MTRRKGGKCALLAPRVLLFKTDVETIWDARRPATKSWRPPGPAQDTQTDCARIAPAGHGRPVRFVSRRPASVRASPLRCAPAPRWVPVDCHLGRHKERVMHPAWLPSDPAHRPGSHDSALDRASRAEYAVPPARRAVGSTGLEKRSAFRHGLEARQNGKTRAKRFARSNPRTISPPAPLRSL